MTDARHLQAGFAEDNGTRLYYEIAGAGQPLVLIHGGLVDRRMWEDQFQVFAHQYRVIRYDLRGQGNSIMPDGPYAHYRDLRELLRFLQIDQAVLLGSSGGGAIAIDCALQYPDVVAALVLVAPGVSGYQWSAEMNAHSLHVRAAFERGDNETAIDLWMQMLTIGPGRSADEVDPDVLERVRDMIRHTLNQPQGQGEPQPRDPPAIDRLADIRVPTLVIIGDQDADDLHTIADTIISWMPNATKVVIPNAAHKPNMEQPDEFNRIVLEFLGTLGGRPS